MIEIKDFTKKISIIAASLMLLSVLIYYFVPAIKISAGFPFILIFLYLITLLVFKMIANSMRNKMSQFANTFMLVNFGKLIFFIFVIVIYAFLNMEDAVSFTLTFFIYYFVFTLYEVFSLLQLKS
ncbi:MAG: hypothetical protein C0598_06440 [Marinilabiliales bacterium]|nr:MAG: hypothetical protein C0598_06440 [Marinilabiliales bacterium]